MNKSSIIDSLMLMAWGGVWIVYILALVFISSTFIVEIGKILL